MEISVVRGDITEQHVDAIVNAANSSLLGGGGVDGAIHRRGGPENLAECRRLRASQYGKGMPTGQAVATTAGSLPARWVIHTVGPVYAGAEDPAGLLASCHRESLRVADSLGARTVAFPAISTGVYGYPVDEAANVAMWTVARTESRVEEVRFVLFDEKTYAAFDRVRGTLTPTDEDVEAELRALPEEHWRDLVAVFDALTSEDRAVTWGGGQQLEGNTTQWPYPIYSEPVRRLFYSLLPSATFDWTSWVRANPLLDEPALLASASVADAARLVTAYVRGERFSEGTLSTAIEHGALDAIVASLRTWRGDS